jgi:hypothetical protein
VIDQIPADDSVTLNLWKPAIDALGQILGHAPVARPWLALPIPRGRR